MKGNSSFAEIIALLKGAKRVLLCTHLMPDGDAIGSMLALAELCRALGVDCRMGCHHPVPAYLRFLPGWEDILLPAELRDEAFDLAFSIDASDEERLGDCGALFFRAPVTIQMDHHETNTMFARHNLVMDEEPASGSVVFRLYEAAGIPFSQRSAIQLYAAISTDTGNFSFGSVTAETFEQVARLMRSGLPLAQSARALHLMQERQQVLLQGRALYSLRFSDDGRLSEMRLTQQDFRDCGATNEHADSIVNLGLYIPGVAMCYLATEQEEGIKFSLRAIAPYKVSDIAFSFGGGGHAQAAGCTIPGPMDEAIARVRSAMLKALNP